MLERGSSGWQDELRGILISLWPEDELKRNTTPSPFPIPKTMPSLADFFSWRTKARAFLIQGQGSIQQNTLLRKRLEEYSILFHVPCEFHEPPPVRYDILKNYPGMRLGGPGEFPIMPLGTA